MEGILVKQAEKIMVRMPAGLRDRVKAAADLDHRSMNSQIIVILERALASDERERPAGRYRNDASH